MTNRPLKTHSCARTDVGCVRKNNEDSYFANDDLGLYVVCDGMGGHDGGDIASAVAVDSVVEFLRTQLAQANRFQANRFQSNRFQGRNARAWLEQIVVDAICQANRDVCSAADKRQMQDMGTTITMLLVQGHQAVVANCGDSRIYRGLRRWELLTTDHTLQQQLRDVGCPDHETHRYGHILTRVLGREGFTEPDVQRVTLAPGSRFLLCSDGLSRYLPVDSAPGLFCGPSPSQLLDLMFLLAHRRGGVDNITAVVVDIE